MAAVAAFPKFQDLSFTCPKVLAKVYVTNGPSGWPETFVRKRVDEELARFVTTQLPMLDVEELVDMFVATRELDPNREPTDWFSIVGFLGRQLGVSPKAVPHGCGIAFWGKVVLATTANGAN